MGRFLLHLFLLSIVIVSGGCIPVEEIGDGWNKGILDNDLAGYWQRSDFGGVDTGELISIKNVKGHYELNELGPILIFGISIPIDCKTVQVGKRKFLILKMAKYFKDQQAEIIKLGVAEKPLLPQHNYEVMLLKYSVENDILTFYEYNEDKLQKAIKSRRLDKKLFKTVKDSVYSTVALSTLDKNVIASLGGILGDSPIWEEQLRYKRVDDIDKALAIAKKKAEEAAKAHQKRKKQKTDIISGVTVDSSGVPVAGAKIRLYSIEYIKSRLVLRYKTPKGLKLLAEIESDAEGKFAIDSDVIDKSRLHSGEVMLVAKKDGLALGWHQFVGNGHKDINVVLGEPKRVFGKVVTSDGKILENAKVRVVLLKKDGSKFNMLHGVEPLDWLADLDDRGGRFEFDLIDDTAEVDFKVRAGENCLIYTGCPGLRRSKPFTVRKSVSAESGEFIITFPKLAGITGKLFDKTSGNGIGGLELEVTSSWNNYVPYIPLVTRTNEEGFFYLDGLFPQTYKVKISEKESAIRKIGIVPPNYAIHEGEILSGDIEATALKRFKVIVRDVKTEKKIPDATAIIRSHPSSLKRHHVPQEICKKRRTCTFSSSVLWTEITTDDDGQAVFELPSCKYVLEVSADGYQKVRTKVVTIEDDDESIVFWMGQPRKAYISVVGSDGKAAGNTELLMYEQDMNDTIDLPFTDENGKVELDQDDLYFLSSTAGIRYVIARDPNENLVSIVKVPREFDNLIVKLEPGATVVGHFIDDKGKPIAGVPIELSIKFKPLPNNSQDNVTGISGEDGFFQINGVPFDVKMNLYAEPKGYSGYTKRDFKVSKVVVDFGSIVLRKANYSLSGRVIDSSGMPVSGASVSVSGNSQPPIQRITTGKDGRFTFNGVMADEIIVNVKRGDKYKNVKMKTVGGKKDLEIVMEKK